MLAQTHRAPVASPGAGGAPRYNRRPSAAIPFRMNVLFEDDGQLKAGTVLADHDASLQVEAASGKRLKIKASQRAAALRVARRGGDARRGATPRRRNRRDVPVGSHRRRRVRLRRPCARVLRRAACRPRRPRRSRCSCPRRRCISIARGKGRYRKAPADALKAALASVERKKREAAQADEWTADLAAHRLPDAFAAEAVDAALPARQERARMEGAGARV